MLKALLCQLRLCIEALSIAIATYLRELDEALLLVIQRIIFFKVPYKSSWKKAKLRIRFGCGASLCELDIVSHRYEIVTGFGRVTDVFVQNSIIIIPNKKRVILLARPDKFQFKAKESKSVLLFLSGDLHDT